MGLIDGHVQNHYSDWVIQAMETVSTPIYDMTRNQIRIQIGATNTSNTVVIGGGWVVDESIDPGPATQEEIDEAKRLIQESVDRQKGD